jgi:hypothetical protein
MCKLTSSNGLNNWFGYFCMWNFFIRGYFELKLMDFDEFISLSLAIGLVLRFYQEVSKNWWVDIMCYFANQHCLIVDVIETFKTFACCCPTI